MSVTGLPVFFNSEVSRQKYIVSHCSLLAYMTVYSQLHLMAKYLISKLIMLFAWVYFFTRPDITTVLQMVCIPLKTCGVRLIMRATVTPFSDETKTPHVDLQKCLHMFQAQTKWCKGFMKMTNFDQQVLKGDILTMSIVNKQDS